MALVSWLSAAALVPALVVTPASPVVRTGTLRIQPHAATAGDTADTFTFTYTAPARPGATGTITIPVPAGFTPPQSTSPGRPGYVTGGGTCARFLASASGSAITVGVTCAGGTGGTLTYSGVAVPTAAGAYSFAGTFTPAGATAATPFGQADAVTVKAGKVASLALTPAGATISPGASQAYLVAGADAYGNPTGDLTAAAKLKISPDGSCTGATCTATTPGAHTVTATAKKLTATAALTVRPTDSDVAVAVAVDTNAPAYHTDPTVTVTVTNRGPDGATDVSAALTLPAGLTYLGADSAAYDAAAGRWTIGDLPAGGTATLHVTTQAGPVADGTGTVGATVSSTSPDGDRTNNTAVVTEASQPAHLTVVITPDPGNPAVIDISSSQVLSWTATVYETENPAAPVPAGRVFWLCETLSENPCPPFPDGPTLSFASNQLLFDQYFLTAYYYDVTDPNFTDSDYGSAPLTFTTTTGGGL